MKKYIAIQEKEGMLISRLEPKGNSLAMDFDNHENWLKALSIPYEIFTSFTKEDQKRYEHLARYLGGELVIMKMDIEPLDIERIKSGSESGTRNIQNPLSVFEEALESFF